MTLTSGQDYITKQVCSYALNCAYSADSVLASIDFVYINSEIVPPICFALLVVAWHDCG